MDHDAREVAEHRKRAKAREAVAEDVYDLAIEAIRAFLVGEAAIVIQNNSDGRGTRITMETKKAEAAETTFLVGQKVTMRREYKWKHEAGPAGGIKEGEVMPVFGGVYTILNIAHRDDHAFLNFVETDTDGMYDSREFIPAMDEATARAHAEAYPDRVPDYVRERQR